MAKVKKKSGHGGARPGAGNPSKTDGTKKVQVAFYLEEMLVEQYGKKAIEDSGLNKSNDAMKAGHDILRKKLRDTVLADAKKNNFILPK